MLTTLGAITIIVLVKDVAFFGRREFDMGNSGLEAKDVAQEDGLTREERTLAAWKGFLLLLFAPFPILGSVAAMFLSGQPVASLLMFALGAAMAALGGGALHGAKTGRRNTLCMWALKLDDED